MQQMIGSMEAMIPASTDESFGQFVDILDSISSSCGIEGYNVEDGFEKYFESFLKDMNGFCSSDEEEKFHTTMDEFSECVGFDDVELRETIYSDIAGVVVNCLEWGVSFSKLESPEDILKQKYAEGNTAFKQCTDAMFGDNILGNSIHEWYLHPERNLACFEKVEISLPKCTVRQFPIPLYGAIYKKSACVVNQLKENISMALEYLADHELNGLDLCLPTLENEKEQGCKTTVEKCEKQIVISATGMFIHLPEFEALALPDVCLRLAETKYSENKIIERYNKFNSKCVKVPALRTSTKSSYGTKFASSQSSKGTTILLTVLVVLSLQAAIAALIYRKKVSTNEVVTAEHVKNVEEYVD